MSLRPSGSCGSCLSVFLPIVAAIALLATPARAIPSAPSPHSRCPLRLKAAVLNPEDLPGTMMLGQDSPSAPYLLQFVGPVRREWREAVEECGVRLLEFVPDHAFVAQSSPAGRARLQSLPFVRWVGPYSPALRVQPQLRRAVGEGLMQAGLYRGAHPDVVSLMASLWGFQVKSVRQHSLVVQGQYSRAERLASLPGVSWVELSSRMHFLNDRSRVIMGVPVLWYDLNLYGKGQVIAVTDTGLDTGNLATLNRDFLGRVKDAVGLAREDYWADETGHGTHVAGSIVGTGANSGASPEVHRYAGSLAGVAPEAQIIVQATEADPMSGVYAGVPEDLYDLFASAYGLGARIHNNSWGDGDAPRGDYNLHAQQVDTFVWEHPDYTVLFAAGNEGSDIPPYEEPSAPPDPYGPLPILGDPSPGEDGSGDGDQYPGSQSGPDDLSLGTGRVEPGSLYAPSSAKNCLSVGASEGYRPPDDNSSPSTRFTWQHFSFMADPIASDYVSDNPEGMVAFSSRGPASDGRLKPDLVAPGSNIVSVRSPYVDETFPWYVPNNRYLWTGGTSMSCAFASGVTALLRQSLVASQPRAPSAAMLKAILLNTAHDLVPGQYGTGKYQEVPARPNIVEGWGRVDAASALQRSNGRILGRWDDLGGLNTGDTRRYYFRLADGTTALRISLVWSDAPASVAAGKSLVNDLDLVVIAPDGKRFTGNGVVDRTNNVEGVDIARPLIGFYTVEVTAYEVPEGPQPFALVASGGVDPDFRLRAVGDLTNDGAISISDVIALMRLILNREPFTLQSFMLADVAPAGSPDGRVDITDAVRLLRFTVGLATGPWP